MGTIWSRLRKSESTTELLEGIDQSITHLEKFRRANQELRQKVIGKLLLYSVVIYILGAFSLYFFFMPQEWSYRVYGLLPFVLFPFIVYLLKRFLHWFFVRKITQNEEELQRLKDQRKDILENVMETETYKKAKQILEKFDPEVKKKMEEDKKKEEEKLLQSNLNSSNLGLRRRRVPGQPSSPGSPQGRLAERPPPSPADASFNHHDESISQNVQFQTPRRPVVLPRPVLPLNKTNLDKLMDYMIGDGANQRYALICQHCSNHNGMALREEFQYLAFRCAYCQFFNPARKQRPNAPTLPTSSPRRMNESSNCDPSTDDETEVSAEGGTTLAADTCDNSIPGSSNCSEGEITQSSTIIDEETTEHEDVRSPADASISSSNQLE